MSAAVRLPGSAPGGCVVLGKFPALSGPHFPPSPGVATNTNEVLCETGLRRELGVCQSQRNVNCCNGHPRKTRALAQIYHEDVSERT